MALNKQTLKNVGRISLYLLAAILIMAVLALLPKIFSTQDFLFQLIVVVFSVVVTAIVTNHLLTGQTSHEEEKEKNSKVFEKKLTIYQDFLQKLCDVIEDDEITKQEAIQIEFATSYIAMHMKDSEDVEEVIKNVTEIVDNMGATGTDKEDKVSTPKALFNIVSVFKKDLYNAPYDKKDEHIKNAIQAFEDIVKHIEGQVESEEEVGVDDTADTDLEATSSNFQKILDDIISQMGNGWQATITKENPIAFSIDKGDRSKLAFFLYCDPIYYFQLHIRVPEREYIDVYDPFKWRFGGRRNKYSWWQYVKPEYRNRETFMKLLADGDQELHKYVVTQTVARLKYFEAFWDLYSTVEIPIAGETGIYNGWSLKPAFAYRCIAFDKNDDAKTYFDVLLNENGTYSILLHNRSNNEQALIDIVNSIGDTFNSYIPQGESFRKHLYRSEISADNVVEEVKKLVEKIG